MPLTAAGPLSVPKQKLFDALVASEALQFWWNQPTPADVANRLYFSLLRVPDVAGARPFGVIELTKDFSYEQYSGGGQNYLSLRSGTLRLTLTEDDKFPENIHEGDAWFENNVGLVMRDLADVAGADDNLTINRIGWDQTPTRNPPASWQSEGMYIWCALLIRFGEPA